MQKTIPELLQIIIDLLQQIHEDNLGLAAQNERFHETLLKIKDDK